MVGRQAAARLTALCLLAVTLMISNAGDDAAPHGFDAPRDGAAEPAPPGGRSHRDDGALVLEGGLGAVPASNGAYPLKAMEATLALGNGGDAWFDGAGASLMIYYNNMTLHRDAGANATGLDIPPDGEAVLGFGDFEPDVPGFYHFIFSAWASMDGGEVTAELNWTVKVKDVRSFEVEGLRPSSPSTPGGVYGLDVEELNATIVNTGNKALSHLYVNFTVGGPGLDSPQKWWGLGYNPRLAPGESGSAAAEGWVPSGDGVYWMNATLSPQGWEGDPAWHNTSFSFDDILDLSITDFTSHSTGGVYPNASAGITVLVNNTGNVDYPFATLHAHLDITGPGGASSGYGPGGAGKDVSFTTAGLRQPGESYAVAFANFTPLESGEHRLSAGLTDAADDVPADDGLARNVTFLDVRTASVSFVHPTQGDTLEDTSGLKVRGRLENGGNVPLGDVTVKLSLYDRGNGTAAMNATSKVFAASRTVTVGEPGTAAAFAFANWTEARPGNYTARMRTSIVNDTDSGDDQAEVSFIIAPSQRLGGIFGHVRGPRGQAVEGAQVTLRAGVELELAGGAVTDNQGYYRISPVVLPEDDVLQYPGYFNLSAEGYPRYALGYADVPFLPEGTFVEVDVYLAQNDLPVVLDPHDSDFAIPVDVDITAYFDMDMDPASVNSTTFTLETESGVPVEGVIDALDNDTYVLDPVGDLAMGTTYVVTVSGMVRDAGGGHPLWEDAVSSWTTEEDYLSLPVEVRPDNGAHDVGLDPDIHASFDVALAANTVDGGSFYLLDEEDLAVDAMVNVDANDIGGTTLTLVLSGQLEPGTNYTAVLTTEITDTEGRHFASDYTWLFRTRDVEPPRVGSINLNDYDKTAVPLNARVELTFTNPMDLDSLKDHFRLYYYTDEGDLEPVDGNFILTDGGTVLQFQPVEGLRPDTDHRIELSGDAVDEDGTPLGEDFTYSFHTALAGGGADGAGDGGDGEDEGGDLWILVAILLVVLIVVGVMLFLRRPAGEVEVEEEWGGGRRGWAVAGGGEEWEGDFQCPECRSLVSSMDTTCPNCDTAFEEEAFICPTCRKPVAEDAGMCASCGERFDVQGYEVDEGFEGGLAAEGGGAEVVEAPEERDEYSLDEYIMPEDEYEVVEDDEGLGTYVKLGGERGLGGRLNAAVDEDEVEEEEEDELDLDE